MTRRIRVVTCADGEVSVYTHCGYCKHCAGVRVGKRMIPTPQRQVLSADGGVGIDENLLNAAIMFNTLVRDGTAIECEDDAGEGSARCAVTDAGGNPVRDEQSARSPHSSPACSFGPNSFWISSLNFSYPISSIWSARNRPLQAVR